MCLDMFGNSRPACVSALSWLLMCRVSVVQNSRFHSSSGSQVSPDCRCSTSRRDLVCEHWIHGTVKEARNVLFAPSTATDKLYVAELAEMTADDSVVLEEGPSSHKAQEPLDSLECALMSVLMKSKEFFAARQPER